MRFLCCVAIEVLKKEINSLKNMISLFDRAGCFHGRMLIFYLTKFLEYLNMNKTFFGEASYNKSDLDSFFGLLGYAVR